MAISSNELLCLHMKSGVVCTRAKKLILEHHTSLKILALETIPIIQSALKTVNVTTVQLSWFFVCCIWRKNSSSAHIIMHCFECRYWQLPVHKC